MLICDMEKVLCLTTRDKLMSSFIPAKENNTYLVVSHALGWRDVLACRNTGCSCRGVRLSTHVGSYVTTNFQKIKCLLQASSSTCLHVAYIYSDKVTCTEIKSKDNRNTAYQGSQYDCNLAFNYLRI